MRCWNEITAINQSARQSAGYRQAIEQPRQNVLKGNEGMDRRGVARICWWVLLRNHRREGCLSPEQSSYLYAHGRFGARRLFD